MIWHTLQMLLSVGILWFFGTILVYLLNIYGRWRTALVLGGLFLIFGCVGSILFPYISDRHGGMAAYMLRNQMFLFTLPFLFSVALTHLICLVFFRRGSLHYRWEGDTLYLSRRGEKVEIQKREIEKVDSIIHPFQRAWINPMKLFRVRTSNRTFWFDEVLEESYWRESDRVAFWSLKDGREQTRRNARFIFGHERASTFFRNGL